jgi:hypothetical protein
MKLSYDFVDVCPFSYVLGSFWCCLGFFFALECCAGFVFASLGFNFEIRRRGIQGLIIE